jgi:RNA polymerase sigma-70 factor (ECF subfamily)
MTPGDDVLRRAASGERDALGELFREYHPGLLRFLRGLAVAHADDVASQVWIEVARSLPRFRGGPTEFRRWLYAIARRRMIDAFRADGRRLEDSVGALPEHGVDITQEDSAEWAQRLFRRLPRSQAEVVFLRSVAGFDVEEVARITRRSQGAVRVLAHRGLTRLRELLADEELLPVGVTLGPAPSME